MLRKIVFALSLIPLAACSVEQGKVPVIDELVVPATATLASDGTYHVDATISFHDDDDAVNRIRVQAGSLGTAEYPANGQQTASKAPFTIQIAGSAAKGEVILSIIILDVANNSSDTKTATVTLN